MVTGISAITLATHDMARAVAFYRIVGFAVIRGGDEASFTSFRAGSQFLNLILQPAGRQWSWWGRLIFYDDDVDGLYRRLVAAGLRPEAQPRDGGVARYVLGACRAAQVDTIVTAHAFVEKGRLEKLIAGIEGHVRLVYLEDIRKTVTFSDKLFGALRQCAVADHVGEHDGGQFTLLGRAHLSNCGFFSNA